MLRSFTLYDDQPRGLVLNQPWWVSSTSWYYELPTIRSRICRDSPPRRLGGIPVRHADDSRTGSGVACRGSRRAVRMRPQNNDAHSAALLQEAARRSLVKLAACEHDVITHKREERVVPWASGISYFPLLKVLTRDPAWW